MHWLVQPFLAGKTMASDGNVLELLLEKPCIVALWHLVTSSLEGLGRD